MNDKTVDRKPGKLRLSVKGSKTESKKTISVGKVEQTFSRGQKKTVTVEVKRPRQHSAGRGGAASGAQTNVEREKRIKAIQALQSGGSKTTTLPPSPRPVRLKPTVKPVEQADAPAVDQAAINEQAALEAANAVEAANKGGGKEDNAVEAAAVDAASSEAETPVEAALPTEPAAVEAEVASTTTLKALPIAEVDVASEAPAEQATEAVAETEAAPTAKPELTQEEKEMLALKQAESVEREKLEAVRREAAARAEAAAPRRQTETRRPGTASRTASAPGRAAPAGRRGPAAPIDPEPIPDGPSRGRDDDRRGGRRSGAVKDEEQRRQPAAAKRGEARRRPGKLTIAQALDGDVARDRTRSLASVRRARDKEKERQRQQRGAKASQKVLREVSITETILVSELASRMAVRGGDVVKKLKELGVMVSADQVIDADTAELVVEEFGHSFRRVSEADVEIGLDLPEDDESDLQPRPAIVTVMGHVDHGKTSLLDALRKTNVVSGEAGGITQHIGAYQVVTPSGAKITFLDTPGHAAFSSMRQRGAQLTDLVILVVAADDSVQPQTIEAINHARAAGAPMIVAINKCDRPEAEPDRIKQELLSQEVVSEDFGGDVQMIPISATRGDGLDDLLEAIALQSEILDLKANPDNAARGGVVEAQLDRGRGAVATVLVQSGTLRRGDVMVAGAEWGRVRAMFDENGDQVKEAGPSMPVSVLGLSGVPMAGDEVAVVPDESRAREISEYRQRVLRDKRTSITPRGTIEDIFSKIAAGETQELPIVLKTDVHGSQEAIVAAISKLANDEVSAKVLHAAVGGINESDVTLASSAGGFIVGFNVRASAPARRQAQQDGVDIRYYSIIYELLDDLKAAVEGLLAPEQREKFIGNAEIREVFNITKVGKIAGCRITDGVVRRGAGVRLLRDNVVIHQGKLGTLKRFKEEVREVREGFECGMAFENYEDIQAGDIIECYEIEEVARTL